jgi:hypothetical protein
MTDTGDRRCLLVTAGCTTGWTDWIHGELWVCPDGLLRRALGPGRTVRHLWFPTVRPGEWQTNSFSAEEVDRIVATGRTNLWVAYATIATASLRDSQLAIETRTGHRITLMWVPVDDVTPLRTKLADVPGDRLRSG